MPLLYNHSAQVTDKYNKYGNPIPTIKWTFSAIGPYNKYSNLIPTIKWTFPASNWSIQKLLDYKPRRLPNHSLNCQPITEMERTWKWVPFTFCGQKLFNMQNNLLITIWPITFRAYLPLMPLLLELKKNYSPARTLKSRKKNSSMQLLLD